MKYARMAESRLVKTAMPQLSGGLNVYDIPSRVADNQLTACDNLWWHRGTLRTRPGIICGGWFDTDNYSARQIVDERTALLTRFERTDAEYVTFSAAQLTDEADGFARLGAKEKGYTLYHYGDISNLTAMGIRCGKNQASRWYYLLSTGDVIRESWSGEGWEEAEPYIPTVLINGAGEECVAEAEPSVYEDYNMLTRAFQCHYTTDGTSTTWKLPMDNLATDLPGVVRDSEAGGIIARIELDVYGENGLRTIQIKLKVDESGKITDEDGVRLPLFIPISADEAGVDANYGETSVRITFDPKQGKLTTAVWGRDTSAAQGGTTEISIGSLPAVTDNNLRITAWRGREYEENRLTICRMTRGTWFGGDRSGIAGGTRYFVCGDPEEPDLLCWSGIEHPLYFPEHNRVRVGNTHSAITALGKQSNLLVIYKDHELYGMQYLSTDSTDYDFATSGGVAVTSYMATFVLTPINAGVGCDCPDTVWLVNNRLVWGNSDGNVYMLTATNQYSERNVRLISRNVRDAIAACGKATLKRAQAAELAGYYLMMAGNRVFLMNAQTSAFSSFSYYDDEDRASKAIPWYVWTLPEHLDYAGVVPADNCLRMVVINHETQEGAVAMLTEDVDNDNGQPIAGIFSTKLWNFGVEDLKKSVEHLYLGVRCQDMPYVTVTYITEKGRYIDPYRMKNAGRTDAGCCLVRHLTPNVRMVQVFGLQIDSRAALEVDGITMKIKTQGVVR